LSKRRAFSVIALLTKSASIVDARGRRGRLRLLEQVQEAPRVAVGIADQRIDRLVVEREAVERLLRALEQLTHLVVVERLQHVHLRATAAPS
jgi:methionine synthase II (cobalamin-independent)